MGGINKIEIIIKEPFASQIREKMQRYYNNELNDEEIKQAERARQILQKYNAIWL